MSWGEAIRLTSVLAGDPSAMVGATLAGWSHPMTREDMTLRDLFDLQHTSKAKKKPKPYPRPWPAEGVRKRGKTQMSRAEIVAVLNAHGHSLSA